MSDFAFKSSIGAVYQFTYTTGSCTYLHYDEVENIKLHSNGTTIQFNDRKTGEHYILSGGVVNLVEVAFNPEPIEKEESDPKAKLEHPFLR